MTLAARRRSAARARKALAALRLKQQSIARAREVLALKRQSARLEKIAAAAWARKARFAQANDLPVA